MSFGDEHDYQGDPGQTRTRLPDGGGDGYGGTRRPVRASRSLVTVVGVVVLLVAAIAFANRGGGSHDSAAGGSGGHSGGSGSGAAADPTAPTGVKPVKGASGTGSGTSIPSGFANDQQGAGSAAANYAVALGSDGMFHTAQRHQIIATIYAPSATAKVTSSLDSAYSAGLLLQLGLDANGNAPEGSTFVSRTIPVGTKVESFSQGAARVSVWYTGLVGMAGADSQNPVATTWKTATFDLRWTGNDWKTVAYAQKNGPAPVPGDDAASTADQITKAVQQFGGFTYAR